MGMAITTMELTILGFCWTIYETHVQYSVIVDAYYKKLDVKIMQFIMSEETIEELESVFATHGFPKQLVTDNVTSFTSDRFQEFISMNGIKCTFFVSYHPATNGQAEGAVQSLKGGLHEISSGIVEERLMY